MLSIFLTILTSFEMDGAVESYNQSCRHRGFWWAEPHKQSSKTPKSLICKLESMSRHMKFHIFSMTFFIILMVPNMLLNGTR